MKSDIKISIKNILKNQYQMLMKKGINLAVIASFVFFGVQQKENAKATRSATASATINTMADWYIAIGTNKEYAEAFYDYMAHADKLTEQQRFPYIMSLHAIFLSFENTYILLHEGTLDPRIHESMVRVLNYSKYQPGLHLYWKSRKALFFPEFQEYIDEIINSKTEAPDGVFKKIEKETNQ